MLIKSIHIREGIFERKIEFSSSVNLIHSENNSSGKTTLIRLILYGLGYNIPSTRNIKFGQCEVILIISSKSLGTVKLLRNNDISIILEKDGMQQTYVLPEQQQELHKELFDCNNNDILKNLLGAFYVDQEKGWTLLNRGIVIGSIHFNIEELIRGLSNRDCSELIKKEEQLLRKKTKYKAMFSVAQYRESIAEELDSFSDDSYEEETNARLNSLLLQQQQLKSELRRIDKTLSDNNRFKKYIADMKLIIQLPNGIEVAVTENNIVGLNDSIELLVAKRKMVSSELAYLSSEISNLEKEKNNEIEQLKLFNTLSSIEFFDKKIMRIPLNPQAIQKEIALLEKEIKSVRDMISRETKLNNSVVKDMSKSIIKYLIELGLGDKDTIHQNYLFTSNLKELSGAILHKTAFAFRLAYIIAIKKAINIKLPIILDSPSGKEIDQNNVQIMMNILKRDFSDHQLIIASIFNYDFDELKIIEIKDRLLNSSLNPSQ